MDQGDQAMALETNALVRVSVSRWRIMSALATRPHTVCELARKLEMNKSATHKHLQRLVRDGLLARLAASRWVYYRLSPVGHAVLRELALLPGGAGDDGEPPR